MADPETPAKDAFHLTYERSSSYREDAVDGFNWQLVETNHGVYGRLTATQDVVRTMGEIFPAEVIEGGGIRQTGERHYEQKPVKVELFTARLQPGALVDLAVLLARQAHSLDPGAPEKIRKALKDSGQNA